MMMPKMESMVNVIMIETGCDGLSYKGLDVYGGV